MKNFFALRPKTYSYLVYNDDDVDDSEYKKAKGTKKGVTKRKIRFKNIKIAILTIKLY